MSQTIDQKSTGISLGASCVKLIELKRKNGIVFISRAIIVPHEGNPRKCLKDAISKYNIDFSYPAVVTGRNMRYSLNIPTISAPHSMELAYEFVNKNKPYICYIIII